MGHSLTQLMALAFAGAPSNGEALADASAIGYYLIINYLNKIFFKIPSELISKRFKSKNEFYDCGFTKQINIITWIMSHQRNRRILDALLSE